MLAKIVFSILAASLLFPPLLFAQSHNEFQLSDYRWENRLLLVFAPSPENAEYRKQIEALNSRKDGMLDRDLKIFHLFREGVSFGEGLQIEKESVDGLYQKYNIQPGKYLIVLIGKDGTEKLRKSSLLKPEKLFKVIDSMPMRQREMRENGQ